ncbi:MAG: M20/M25/M40 family metallo-hydrolase, partial [Pseudomonadota bacterium]
MEKKVIEAINAQVDSLYDDMVSTLQDLVRIPSVTGEEGPAQEYMKKQYQALGLEVHSLLADEAKVKSHFAYCYSGHPFEGRPNIIGLQKGDPDKQSIILNGHVDVVTAEPLDQWKHAPYAAEIEGDKMYGRGVADMKSGLITNLFALKALNQAGLGPVGSIMLQSVIE